MTNKLKIILSLQAFLIFFSSYVIADLIIAHILHEAPTTWQLFLFTTMVVLNTIISVYVTKNRNQL